MSENTSLLSCLIYRAIHEPETWQTYSIELLVELLANKYDLAGPENLVQIKVAKKFVGRLKNQESFATGVTSIFERSRFGLLLIDETFRVIYYNEKINPYLDCLLDIKNKSFINDSLRSVIETKINHLIQPTNGELIHLDFDELLKVNIYLRLIQKSNFTSAASGDYVYQIMTVSSEDNNQQIFQQVSKAYSLSEREINIVQSAVRAFASGGSIKEIADELFISLNTVKTHLKSIYTKSGVNSLAALVSLYLQHEVQQLSAYLGCYDQTEYSVCNENDKVTVLESGQELYYREYGDLAGKPLIVLHNSYASRLNIPPQGDAIADKLGRRIIIPDRPGFGKSPANNDYPRVWNKQLAEFSEQLNLSEFDILGDGLSVRYVLEFAEEFPHKISKIIMCSPLLHLSNEDKYYSHEWLSVTTKFYERSPEVATEIYNLWHSSASLLVHDYVEKNIEYSTSSAEKGVVDDSSYINIVKNNFKESAAQEGVGSTADFHYCFNKSKLELSKISIYTEIWIGSENELVNPDGVKKIFNHLPNKKILEKEGYGEHIYYSLFEEIIV